MQYNYSHVSCVFNSNIYLVGSTSDIILESFRISQSVIVAIDNHKVAVSCGHSLSIIDRRFPINNSKIMY